ncbi:MAG: hypothetical protein WCG27_06755 [Pseudomonadota bacterium]
MNISSSGLLLILLFLTISVWAEPGSSVGVSLPKEEKEEIIKAMQSKYPDLNFVSWDIKKLSAPSRAQGGFYYDIKASAVALKECLLDKREYKKDDKVVIKGNFDKTRPPENQWYLFIE